MEELTFEQSYLLDVLQEHHMGRLNAVTARELRIHGRNPRELRRIVHDLRVLGYPICSGQEGYYYAENSRELAGTMRFLESYLKEMQEAINGIRGTYYEMTENEGNQGE